MITSIFKKSTILNNSLVVFLLLFFYFLYQSSVLFAIDSTNGLIINTLKIVLLLASFFLVNFLVKKNGLTKNSSYTILFFLLFILIFPAIFNSSNLLLASFFLLLAIRRLISLQTLKEPKEKIFDASMWIFIASLFHFWCVLFIVIVYISIIFHASRDYRNWLLPFVAFATTTIIFLFLAFVFDKTWIDHLINQSQTNFEINYFVNKYQNAALSLYVVIALYFIFSMVFSMSSRPLNLQASYKKMIFGFLIGVAVFMISPEKNSAILSFTFLPLAVMCTTNIEYSQNKTYREIVLLLLIVSSFFAFFLQL